jgi:hypothetical protein
MIWKVTPVIANSTMMLKGIFATMFYDDSIARRSFLGDRYVTYVAYE